MGFLKAIDKALMLSIEQRPQSIPAWRGDLLAPDPPRTGWRARGREKKLEEPEVAAPNEITERVSAPPTVLPPPDVPAAKGSMLNILDGLRKKPAVEVGRGARTGKAAARASEGGNARAGQRSQGQAGEAGEASSRRRRPSRSPRTAPSSRSSVRRDRGR